MFFSKPAPSALKIVISGQNRLIMAVTLPALFASRVE